MIKSECSQKGKNKDCQMDQQDWGLPDGYIVIWMIKI